MNAALDYLDRLMTSRLCAVLACRRAFPAGYQLEDRVLPVPRVILVESGAMNYRLDGRRWRFKKGDLVLVPAFARRSWTASRSTGVTLAWFEYDIDGNVEQLTTLCTARSKAPADDAAAMDRIIALFDAAPGKYSLEADGEMKALLGRLLSHAKPSPPSHHESRTNDALPAVRHIAEHYADDDVLEKGQRRSRLSENHYRLVFKRRMGMSPTQYLMQVRMRMARHLLQQPGALVKETAMRVGYADPFHFSRAYRRYWKRSPREDRAG